MKKKKRKNVMMEPASAQAPPLDASALKPSIAGVLLYYLCPIRKRTIINNMRQVFGDRPSATDIRKLAQSFYSHFLRSIRENLSLIWVSKSRHVKNVDIIGVEHMLKAAEKQKGILVMTGHFGNWEYAGLAAIRQFEEFRDRFHIIRKTLNVGLERMIVQRHLKSGLRIIRREDALSQALDALANNDAIIYVMDQHASTGPKSVRVELFGAPAGTNRSLGLMAAHTGAPVIPATSYRTPEGRHVMRFHAPVELVSHDDPTTELRLNTRKFNQIIERFVLEHPEQWFWMHKRWKKF
jgi:KDO2-lipid IV(A) lauroyltransferase